MTDAADSSTGQDTRRHLTTVARGGAISLAGATVSAVAGFALVLVVTNYFSADAAGTFFAVTSVLLLLVALSSLGTETGLARFMLRFESLGRVGDLRHVVRVAFRSSLTLAVVLAVALFAFAEPVAEAIGVAENDGPTMLRVLAACLPFVALNNLSLAGTRAFGRMGPTAKVDSIGRSAAQPALATAVGLAGAGSIALTTSWVIPYVVASSVSGVMFLRLLRRRGVLSAEATPVTPYADVRREFWSFTWPRAITRISQMAIQRADIVLVAALLSPKDAALYTAATRFVALGQVAAQAIQQVLQPKFTELLVNEDEHAVLSTVYRVSAAWAMAVSWPLYLVVGCSPVVYLGLFGSGYGDDGELVVMVMAGSMMLAVASGSADTLLLMSGHSRLSLLNSLLALAIDLTLCFVLIPQWGISGAAVAWGVAVLTKCTLAFIQARVILHVVSFGASAAVVAAAGVVCLGLPMAALSAFSEPDAWRTAGAAAVCLAAYAGALWLGRRQLMLGVFRSLVGRRLNRSTKEPAR